jgi:hypothetical protein
VRDEFEEKIQTTRRQTRGTLARRFQSRYLHGCSLEDCSSEWISSEIVSKPMKRKRLAAGVATDLTDRYVVFF